MAERAKNKIKTRDMTYIAVFAVLTAVCAWISIPTPANVPVTMHTFAVFLALGVLGGKRGTLSFVVYIMLGVAGLPVFAGFRGGVGVLLGTTGGYILGYLLACLLYWLVSVRFEEKTYIMIITMLLGLVVCYAFGTAWYIFMYTRGTGAIGILTALSWCVFPFVIPDIIKIVLAVTLSKRLRTLIRA